jgi:hypothetical protein
VQEIRGTKLKKKEAFAARLAENILCRRIEPELEDLVPVIVVLLEVVLEPGSKTFTQVSVVEPVGM